MTNSPSNQTENAGDSGFQENLKTDDSPLSDLNNEQSNKDSSSSQPTTFCNTTKSLSDHQFTSNHSNHPNQSNQTKSTENKNSTDSSGSNDLNDELNDDESNLEDDDKLNFIRFQLDGMKYIFPNIPNDDNESLTSDSNDSSDLVYDNLMRLKDWTQPNFLPLTDKFDSEIDKFWKFIYGRFSADPPAREKLNHVNTLNDVIDLIKKSKKIIVLTGAGVSVSCGIPDFRSKNGIYSKLKDEFPELPSPESMFDIKYFKEDQRPFFKFAKEIYPGQIKPSLSHRFIKMIENKGKLLCNYTQNIDTLEKLANIERVFTCHGSFSTASCLNCKYQVDGSFIKDDILKQKIPRCPRCPADTDALCVVSNDVLSLTIQRCIRTY